MFASEKARWQEDRSSARRSLVPYAPIRLGLVVLFVAHDMARVPSGSPTHQRSSIRSALTTVLLALLVVVGSSATSRQLCLLLVTVAWRSSATELSSWHGARNPVIMPMSNTPTMCHRFCARLSPEAPSAWRSASWSRRRERQRPCPARPGSPSAERPPATARAPGASYTASRTASWWTCPGQARLLSLGSKHDCMLSRVHNSCCSAVG